MNNLTLTLPLTHMRLLFCQGQQAPPRALARGKSALAKQKAHVGQVSHWGNI